ncbi:hypothetical protein [Clavibacter phaseoli]|jgi:hypothetical protein|uniref:hypothetical protein n=1 Tax=Clavibacter phaseoli TaxID=1734031 RepID=UPI0015F94E68|nr:hypothetical protein [Clavibacter phaseoli]MBM7387508.1 UPF0716 family protein affecting phage T7 exclusion [Clavibacter michiganensis]
MRFVYGLVALWLVLVILGFVIKALAWLVGVGVLLVVVTVVAGAMLRRGSSRDVDRL